jgi:hypothetical protein
VAGTPPPAQSSQPGTGVFSDGTPVPDDPNEAAGRLARLRAQITGALLDTAGLDKITEPVPLVHGMIFMDSLTWLAGRSGHGKSFVALDIAGCVGSGEDAWQTYPVHNGPVLFVVAEGVSGVKPRVRAWEKAMGKPMAGVTFLPMAVQAANATGWEALTEVAAELAAVLVVLDTQARITVGLDENSNRDMGLLVDRLDQLRRATGACVLTVHHQGRNGDHLRGASALDAGSTTVIVAEKSGDVITLSCDPEKGGKQKDVPEFAAINLRMIPTLSSVCLSLTDRSTPTDETTPATARMVSLWWDIHETEPVSVSTLLETTKTPKATFYRARRALVAAGLVEVTGKGSAARYALKRRPAVSPSLTQSQPVSEGPPIDGGESLTVSHSFRSETDETPAAVGQDQDLFGDRPEDQTCEVCGLPLDGFYASHGHKRHLGCES